MYHFAENESRGREWSNEMQRKCHEKLVSKEVFCHQKDETIILSQVKIYVASYD